MAGDPICLTTAVVLILAASQGGRAPGESIWTGLILPFILPAPGQLSLTAGVPGADGWSVSVPPSVPLPLFDAGVGVGRGSHVGSAAQKVSVFVLGMIITDTIAAFSEWEGDAIGAVGWRPLSTKGRVIPILVAFNPLETAATGAIGAAAPLAVIGAEGFAAAGAILRFCRCAGVATSPIEPPMLPLASIISLVVVREEEEEEEQQPAPPCSQH